MDIRQLEAFVSVVKSKSFSRAAEEIFLSQPTISAHVSSLEKELCVQLLVRSTKEVYPTKAGKAFHVYAKNILSLRNQAVLSVKELSADSKGEINILSSTVPTQFFLPEKIALFRNKYPNVVFRVEETDSYGVADKLEEYQYDFGIMGTKIGRSNFTSLPIYDDVLSIAMPKKGSISKENFEKDMAGFFKTVPFIMRESGSGTRKEIEAFFEKIGLSISDLNIASYFSNTQSAVQAVAGGIGVTIASKMALSLHENAGLIKTIDIDPKFFSRKFYLLLKNALIMPPCQSLFIDFLKDSYSPNSL